MGAAARGPGAMAQHLQRTLGNQATQALLQRMVRPPASQPVRGQIRSPATTIQREATRPRAATGAAVIADVTSQTGTQPTGPVTAGSLARQEWESLFRRHFIEPDQIEDEVESSHARYFYSRIYGWIDAQHFFAHIQFAEESGLEAATSKGIGIEEKQAKVRFLVGPTQGDTSIYSDLLTHNLITPDDLLHYREGAFMAIAMAMDVFLGDQERALIQGFDDRQLAKLILDNAMSAWSAEDLRSNQLGVQFFRLHGPFVNAGSNSIEVRQRFVDRLEAFFNDIQVVDSPRTVRSLTSGLPGKERWTSVKMTEDKARSRFPELFDFASKTHRVRIAIYDRRERAERALGEVSRAVPAMSGLQVAPYGRKSFALYSGAFSHFEAIVLKHAVDRAVPTGAGGALVEKN
jgi:hypothetical protein